MNTTYNPADNEIATTHFWILSSAYYRGIPTLSVGGLITSLKNIGGLSMSPRLKDRAAALLNLVIMGGHRKKGHALCEVVTLHTPKPLLLPSYAELPAAPPQPHSLAQ
jgi:hypothetical protein